MNTKESKDTGHITKLILKRNKFKSHVNITNKNKNKINATAHWSLEKSTFCFIKFSCIWLVLFIQKTEIKKES